MTDPYRLARSLARDLVDNALSKIDDWDVAVTEDVIMAFDEEAERIVRILCDEAGCDMVYSPHAARGGYTCVWCGREG